MKIFLKRLLIPVLASRPVTTVASRLFHSGVPVFMLHRIERQHESDTGRISSTHLRKCLDYLVDHGHTLISLETLINALIHNKALPKKSVVFTMDDGYIDQAEIASPIFLEYNCPLTFFVITGMLDQSIWPWDAKVSWIFESSTKSSLENCETIKTLNLELNSNSKRLIRRSFQDALKKMDANVIPGILQQLASDAGVTIPEHAPPSYQAMTWDMARKLETQGIRFAPHSINHNILSRLNQESMEKEIQDVWKKIDGELKNPLKVFCYPNGSPVDYGEREIEIIKNENYLGAVSTTPGFVKHGSNSGNQLYSLPRLALPDNMTDLIKCCTWIESARDTLF